MRLVALVGDGHTHLDLPPGLNRFPFEIAQFDNAYRIILTDEKYADILGSRLIAIDNLPVDTIHKRLTLLVPRGENPGRTLFTSLQFLGSPEILYGLGIIKNKNEALFTFLNDKGQAVEKKIQPMNLRNSNFKMIPAENAASLFDMLREDMPETPAINRMKQLAGQFTRGLQGGALFRTSIYHSHSVDEVLNRIEEYFEAIETGSPYYGEAGVPVEEAAELDSCEAATIA
jgi:hypothetical protein